jgi:hypothetical protein
MIMLQFNSILEHIGIRCSADVFNSLDNRSIAFIDIHDGNSVSYRIPKNATVNVIYGPSSFNIESIFL